MRIYTAYLKKTLLSPITCISVLGVALVCLFGCTTGVGNVSSGVFDAFNVMLDLSSYRKFILFFASLPFVSCFAQEWSQGTPTQIIVRSNAKSYIAAHIIITFVSAFLTCLIGILLCIGLFCLKYPFYPISFTNQYSEPFLKLLNSKETIIQYFIFRSVNFSFSIAAWSLSGLALSSIFLNTFMAVCAPLVFSYIIEMITIESSVLPNLWHLSLSYTTISENTWIAEAYIILSFSVLSIIFSLIFRQFAKRRIANELH